MSKEIIGVIPPIITPIDENEKVDEAGLRKLINHCIDHGIHGIFICGSNGECMSLTQAQRDRAIQIARLSRVIRVAFRVLKEQGGDQDV